MRQDYLGYIVIGLYVAILTWFMSQRIFELGWVMGTLDKEGKLDAIKKRSIKKDNIIKYPFGNPRGKATQTGDSDSIQRSGPESETSPEGPKEA